jgi:hypothetical protein
MSRIRSIVFGTSLFVALAFAVIGGTGINSTMAAASSAPEGQGCIIAVLKSEKAQKVNAVAPSSDDEPGCGITVRKSGGDQHEYIIAI